MIDFENTLRHFQDREDAIAKFDSLWAVDNLNWILVFDGFSGYGKTTLLTYLEVKRCKAEGIPHKVVRFGAGAATKEKTYLAYDEMLERLLMRQYLPDGVVEQYEKDFDEALAQRDARITPLQIEQKQTLGKEHVQQVNLDLAEREREIARQTRGQLTRPWLRAMGHLQNEARVVLMMDTYEFFQDTALEEDQQWLWEVLEQLQARVPGLRVVIGSRVTVRFYEHGVSENPLEPFGEPDSDALLQSLQVADPAFRKAVFDRLAKGHPLVTRMAAEWWHSAPDGALAETIPEVAGTEEAIEWIQNKIIDRITDASLREAVRWTVLLRSFNLDVLNAVLPDGIIPLNAQDNFKQLIQYSFVRKTDVGFGWQYHDLLRRVQINYLRKATPTEFEAFHRQAAAYFDNNKQPVENLYHRFFFEPDEAFTLWYGLQTEASRKYMYNVAEVLFQVAEADEIDLKPSLKAHRELLRGRHHVMLGNVDAARAHYDAALPLYRREQARLGEANVLQSLGDLERRLGNVDAARAHYGIALSTYSELQDPTGQMNVQIGLARLERELGNTTQAQQHYLQVFQIADVIGFTTHPVTLNLYIEYFAMLVGEVSEDDLQPLADLLIAWVQTPDWAASRAYLEQHQATLLTDKGEFASLLLVQSNGNDKTLIQRWLILHACRTESIDTIYGQLADDA